MSNDKLKVKKTAILNVKDIERMALEYPSALKYPSNEVVTVDYEEEVPTLDRFEALKVVAAGGQVRSAFNTTTRYAIHPKDAAYIPENARYGGWAFYDNIQYLVTREPPVLLSQPSHEFVGTLGWAVNEVNYGRGVVHKTLGPVVALADFINGLPDDSEEGWISSDEQAPDGNEVKQGIPVLTAREVILRHHEEHKRWRAYVNENGNSHVGMFEWRKRFDSPARWKASSFLRVEWDAREAAFNKQVDAFTNNEPWKLQQ